MDRLLEQIRATKWHNCELFAKPLHLTENLLRWQDDNNPLHYNKNHFAVQGKLCPEDIKTAITFQKENMLSGLILKAEQPLAKDLIQEFSLLEEEILLMAQLRDESVSWNINDKIEIRDCQKDDISYDLLNACMALAENSYHRRWIRTTMEEALSVAKMHPEYHWLAAYFNGQLVARCYVLEWDGCVQMEDLWVHEEFRHQRIGTSLLKYIHDHFRGTLFFHSEAEDSTKEFYHKLGFDTIAFCYEYRKEWQPWT